MEKVIGRKNSIELEEINGKIMMKIIDTPILLIPLIEPVGTIGIKILTEVMTGLVDSIELEEITGKIKDLMEKVIGQVGLIELMEKIGGIDLITEH